MVLAVIALGLGASQMPYLGDWIRQSVFSILAGVTVVSAAAAVTFRNPIYCAIWFGLTLLGVAGLFLLTGAQFLAVATIVVYAGAILVTFLFVLMLAQPEGKTDLRPRKLGGPVFGCHGHAHSRHSVDDYWQRFWRPYTRPMRRRFPPPSADKLAQGVLSPYHVASFGMELFGRHLIAIEVAGTLLLAALVGAAVIVAQNQRFRISSPADATQIRIP